jgi:S-adenosylmethionine-diacylglycerol 3-amino-3-carboxypropyl transferase
MSTEKQGDPGLVRYANCWEDADILCEALQPAPGKRILSIASAGDNVFALAAEGADVVAADLSAPQLALVELKRAALTRFDRDTVLAFLGLTPCGTRHDLCARLEGDLSPETRSFWRSKPEAIAAGIIHAGRFENYTGLFRRKMLPLIHRRATVRSLFVPRTPVERETFYRRRWDSMRWRVMFRVFFGKFMQGRVGRDPEFLKHMTEPVSEQLLQRTRRELTAGEPACNPFLEYMMIGNFEKCLPRYLREENFARVKAGCARITLVRAAVHEVEGEFDGFNLSDIFEYMTERESEAVFDALLGRARRRARLAYWNLLVDRRCKGAVTPLQSLSAELGARDRGWFYRAFRVDAARTSPVCFSW